MASVLTPACDGSAVPAPALIIYADELHAFTYDEVASRLGVSLTTVERLVARRELKELRVGRAVRVTATELRRYLSGGGA